jgi:hypothetical protein
VAGLAVRIAAAGEERDAGRERHGADRGEERPEGRVPLAEPAMTMKATTTARQAPSAAKALPVVQRRSRFGSTREKRAMRTASPARAGTKVLTSEPAP